MSAIESESEAMPIVHVQLRAGLANKMIEYMVVFRIAAEVDGCRISNAVLPEWNIDHPTLPPAPGPEVRITGNKVDIASIVKMLSSREISQVKIHAYLQWFSNFPDLDLCRTMFKAEEQYPGYGAEFLVCNIRGGDILDGGHPHYTLLPIEFYDDLARSTGLKLVFMGQIEENAYCRALKRRFPDAAFHPSGGPMADFQTFRNSKNLVTAISTFSWLAAWLSWADMIVLPVNGLFHPVQCPDVDLLPIDDERYRFYLFPINYAVPVDHFEKAHKALQHGWRSVDSRTISELRAPRRPRRLDAFVSVFDESFYLQTHRDVAGAVKAGGFESGLDHYIRAGFREGRSCFAFDRHWYSVEYPSAALEVGQSDYVDLMHHYAEVGAMRGYKPLSPDSV